MITTGFVILVRRDGNLLPQHQVCMFTVCRYNSSSLYYVYICLSYASTHSVIYKYNVCIQWYVYCHISTYREHAVVQYEYDLCVCNTYTIYGKCWQLHILLLSDLPWGHTWWQVVHVICSVYNNVLATISNLYVIHPL